MARETIGEALSGLTAQPTEALQAEVITALVDENGEAIPVTPTFSATDAAWEASNAQRGQGTSQNS